MIFINCLRQYNEIHVITKPSSSTCQVQCKGGLFLVLYGIIKHCVVCIFSCIQNHISSQLTESLEKTADHLEIHDFKVSSRWLTHWKTWHKVETGEKIVE